MVVTKHLPGDRWLKILTSANCRVEVSQHEDVILSNKLVKDLIGKQCDGVIGQLTEVRMADGGCITGGCRCVLLGDAVTRRFRFAPPVGFSSSVKYPCSAP